MSFPTAGSALGLGGDQGSEDEGEDQEGDASEKDDKTDAFRPIPFDRAKLIARPVLVGTFAVFALRTGAVVSYDTVNANLAGQDPTLDSVTLGAGIGTLAQLRARRAAPRDDAGPDGRDT